MRNTHIITTGLAVAFAAIALLFMLSCTKDKSNEVDGASIVTFSIPGLNTGSIATKATLDDITAALVATQPEQTPQLTIRSTTDNSVSYTAEVGTPISLPYGTYQVTGNYIARNIGGGLAGYVYKNPCYSINQTVEILERSTELALNARYTCFALILDTDECLDYKHYMSNSTYVDMPGWAEVGKIKVVYVVPSGVIADDKPYKIKAIPKDADSYGAKEYAMISGQKAGSITIENGKWYKFSPRSLKAEIGTIGIGFPDWEQGNTQ